MGGVQIKGYVVKRGSDYLNDKERWLAYPYFFPYRPLVDIPEAEVIECEIVFKVWTPVSLKNIVSKDMSIEQIYRFITCQKHLGLLRMKDDETWEELT